jgi:hypothetical protein
MGDKFSKKLKFFRSAADGALLFLLLSTLARAEGVNQNTAYLDTDVKNRAASDTSLQHSTGYAMNALMDLGNLNIKSAVNNGMNAYGKYRKAETLDKLGDINFNQANAMSSVGANGASAAPRKTDTTFRRLDPSFLRKGEMNQVATEFEKKSGMPRETFLNQLSEVSEKKIRRSDPQLVDKVIGRFENFIAKIPNKDFRGNLQKGVGMVPQSMRTGIISKAVAKFSDMMAPSAAPGPAAEQLASAAPAGGAPAPEEEGDYAPFTGAASEPETTAEASREPASDTAEEANPLGNIIQAALDEQSQDPTIFQIVTRRYRLLTPALAGR